jgi:hypothetical protein
MNYFEQELRRLAKACDGIINPTFVGRACYGDLGGDNRVKLLFVTKGCAGHYEALKAMVLNRLDGEVDTLVFRFKDIWGHKAVGNPNFREGVIPHILTNGGESAWYVYRPTDADFKLLAENVSAYLAVFKGRSLIPEKMHGQTGDLIAWKKPQRSRKKRIGCPL